MSTQSLHSIKPGVDDRAIAPANPLRSWVKSRAAWVLILDLVLVALFSVLSTDHVFWSLDSATALMIGATQALLLALGLALLLGAGIFDLSVGANLVLSSVIGAMVMKKSLGDALPDGSFAHSGSAIALGLLTCLVAGACFGLLNGLIIAVVGINSLIATLATLGIGTGVAFLISGGSDVAGLPATLQSNFGLATMLGFFPYPTLIVLGITLVLWAIIRYTRFGLRTLAIGSSRASAERAGIRVPAHLISLTMLAGTLAGLAGFLDLSRYGSTALNGHNNAALEAITAVVIGGTLLEGGHISVMGTVWGAALAIILQSGLVIIGVSSYWQLIVVGLVLLLAVTLDRVTARRRSKTFT
jgi:ribose transport system permease protein